MYLHCPHCQTSVSGTQLMSSNLACPHCGEPATGPLSFFSSMPRRYRRRRMTIPLAAKKRTETPQIVRH